MSGAGRDTVSHEIFIKFNCLNLSQIQPNNLHASQTARPVHNSALSVHLETRHGRSLTLNESLYCLFGLPVPLISPHLVDSDRAVTETKHEGGHAMTAPRTSCDVLLVKLLCQQQLQVQIVFLHSAWLLVEGVDTLAFLVHLHQIAHRFTLGESVARQAVDYAQSLVLSAYGNY